MSDLIEQRLLQHEEQDHREFSAIRSTLEKIDGKLDVLTEKVIRLDTVHELTREEASKAGALAGGKWSAVIGVVVASVMNACSYITYGGGQ